MTDKKRKSVNTLKTANKERRNMVMKKIGWMLLAVWIVLFACLLIQERSYAAPAQGEIEATMIHKEQLPKGWSITNEFSLPEQQLAQFRSRFMTSLEKVYYQHFKVEGQKEIRLNYVLCTTEKDAQVMYQRMVGMVGVKNVIVRNGRVVVEIISADNLLADEAVKLLPISAIQKMKLRPTKIPKHWRPVSEYSFTGSSLESFEKKFGTRLKEVLNQNFFVNQADVKINYVIGLTEQDSARTHKMLEDMVGKINLIMIKNNVVIEIIGDSPEAKKEAEALLNQQ